MKMLILSLLGGGGGVKKIKKYFGKNFDPIKSGFGGRIYSKTAPKVCPSS